MRTFLRTVRTRCRREADMKRPVAEDTAPADLLERLRARRPRVHCITNAVAETFTANVLLAAGAVPSLTINPDEVADFVSRADALLVNLGTLDPVRRRAAETALAAAEARGLGWVLDPVFVERSALRLALARQLLARTPAIMRCNGAEFEALSGGQAEESRLAEFARASATTVALTGPVDLVSDGTRLRRISNGHELMGRVTAMGCAATALMAAFLSVADDPLHAALACLVTVGIAAEDAGAVANGPGSFVPAYLDRLFAISPEEVAVRARIA
jgi:hydroxyethylthiazole kinase